MIYLWRRLTLLGVASLTLLAINGLLPPDLSWWTRGVGLIVCLCVAMPFVLIAMLLSWADEYEAGYRNGRAIERQVQQVERDRL